MTNDASETSVATGSSGVAAAAGGGEGADAPKAVVEVERRIGSCTHHGECMKPQLLHWQL